MIKLSVLAILIAFPCQLFANIFFMNGKGNIINAKTHLVHSVSLKDRTDKVKIIIYQFKNFTNGVNKQIISEYTPKIIPKPSKIRPFTDKLGNSGLEITFFKSVSDIRIESNFIINNEVQLDGLDNFHEYPLPPATVKHLSLFLNETSLTSYKQSKKLKKLIAQLSQSSHNVFQMVVRIFNWVSRNIEYNPGIFYRDAKRTFLYGQGNRNAILNLCLTMFRMAGIPCRFVHGIAIDESFIFEGKGRNIEIRYPKSLYQWIELYFPNHDWLPFDPLSSYFFLQPNFLRRNVSLDSGGRLDRVVAKNKEKPIALHFYIELSRTNQLRLNKQLYQTISHSFFPVVDYHNRQFIKKLFQPKNKPPLLRQHKKGDNINISLKPFSLDFSNNHEHIDLRITNGSFYSQKVLIKNDFNLKEIRLPLFRFNHSPRGKIWLEIYANEADNSLGRLIGVSTMKEVSQLKNPGCYKWISFNFNNSNKAGLLINKGAIWMVLKYNTQEVFLWKGIFANPFQEQNDTFYSSDKYSSNIFIVYLDLCFQMFGKLTKTTNRP